MKRPNSGSRFPRRTPNEEQGSGSYQVTFSVTDGIATVSEAVAITVNEVNVTPVLAGGSGSVSNSRVAFLSGCRVNIHCCARIENSDPEAYEQIGPDRERIACDKPSHNNGYVGEHVIPRR